MKLDTHPPEPGIGRLSVEAQKAGDAAPTRNLLSRVSDRVGMFWCREFHRKRRQYVEVDERRLKVYCTRCGRKFIRDRHFGYRVS